MHSIFRVRKFCHVKKKKIDMVTFSQIGKKIGKIERMSSTIVGTGELGIF